MNSISVSIDECSDIGKLQDAWEHVEKISDCSFFQSWSWMGAWIESLPENYQLKVIVAKAEDELVGIGVFCVNKLKTKLKFTSKALILSETGDMQYDSLTVEYSGFVIKHEMEKAVLAEIFRCLRNDATYDEFVFSGLLEENFNLYKTLSESCGLSAIVNSQRDYYYVDLALLRKNSQDYLSSISSNSRSQIRRSINAYKKLGEIEFNVAENIDNALEYFAELVELHQHYWISKGQQGAFGHAYNKRFHENLIRQNHDKGRVHLIKINAGEHVVGYLYNFIYAGRVYSYQSGFNYNMDGKYKPGLVSHCLAIEYYLGIDFNIYDFLAGYSQYKRSMATNTGLMFWTSLRRRLLKFQLEKAVTSVYRKIKANRV